MAQRRRPISQTIGGILVGFDHQVFRATKPTPELLESAKPIPPVPAADGGTLRVEVPGAPPPPTREDDPPAT